MRDLFTLVVPTYNRPECLERLLNFLEASNVSFRIRILDSSQTLDRLKNKKLIKESYLCCDYVEYDYKTHPFDKFLAGVNGVTTPFSCLCADDDILLLEGLTASITFLKENPDYSVAHGYYFQFILDKDEMRLTGINYYTPSYEAPDSISRIHELMRHYQALTYGVYRTAVLKNVFATVASLQSLLARELLSSALATVDGKVARLPMLYHGRNLGPSTGHVNWHPLEWFISKPRELFAEYERYRSLLADALIGYMEITRSREEIERLLDLIHMQYFIRHAPDEVFDFIVTESIAGRDAGSIFSTHLIGAALWRAADEFAPLGQLKKRPLNSTLTPNKIIKATWPVYLARKIDLISPKIGFKLREIGKRLLGLAPVVSSSSVASKSYSSPLTLSTSIRRYVLDQAFIKPPASYGVTITDTDIKRLITALDSYQ